MTSSQNLISIITKTFKIWAQFKVQGCEDSQTWGNSVHSGAAELATKFHQKRQKSTFMGQYTTISPLNGTVRDGNLLNME